MIFLFKGLDMGTDCNSVGVFKKMIHSIHDSMMERLASKIRTESTPLSIIVDSSTGGIFVWKWNWRNGSHFYFFSDYGNLHLMSVLFQGTDLNLKFVITFWDSILKILFSFVLFSFGMLVLNHLKVDEVVEDSDYEEDTCSDQSEDDSDDVWSNNEESDIEEESVTDEESDEELPFLYFSRTIRSDYFNEFRQNELSIWKNVLT